MTVLIAAPFTPMASDGSVIYGGIRKHAEGLISKGLDGAFVCGTSGEGMSLSVRERMDVMKAWTEASEGKLELIMHVGCQSIRDTLELAGYAQDLGASAISAMAPAFFKAGSIGDVVGWCREVAASVPEMPFHYYHFPLMTGLGFKAAPILRRMAAEIPTWAGAKFTSEDPVDLRECLDIPGNGGRPRIFLGREELLLAGLFMGVSGAIGSTFTFAGKLVKGIADDHARGDYSGAARAQTLLHRIIAAFRRYGGIAPQKAILDMVGLPGGPARPPLEVLTESDVMALREELMSIGFLQP